MPINKKGARGGSQAARECDRLSGAILPNNNHHHAVKQVLRLDQAIAVCSGTRLIGYVLEIDDSSIAIDADGTMPGNNGRRPISKSYLGEVRPPAGAP